MELMRTKIFDQSLGDLSRRGGDYSRAVQQIFEALGRANFGDPFEALKLTKYGENRIKNCIKYDLNKFCRLIVVRSSKVVFLCFAGTHKDCDKWLGANRGLNIRVDESNRPLVTFESVDISNEQERLVNSRSTFKPALLENLPKTAIAELMSGLDQATQAQLMDVSSLTSDDEILELVSCAASNEHGEAVFDSLMLLGEGKLQEAERRVSAYMGNLKPLEQANAELIELNNSEDWRKLLDTEQYRKLIEHYSKTADYQEWMLFMHPDQESLVEADFDSPSKLVGVSGSGKTCVVVKRAVRLAEADKSAKVLIVTLNRSLAALIKDLVGIAADQQAATRIDVLPLFHLCQRYLLQFEPENEKLYNDSTWKSGEHIDEVWQEYYRCELNSRGAAVMQEVHDSLIGRGIDAENYIREEFDWVRSAVWPSNRKDYLEIKRVGRSYPMPPQFRQPLLEGLGSWEAKMQHVGVTDYLGLSAALSQHLENLKPVYSAVLVDECQDFGTVELNIIRRLVPNQENDIFLCGDAAQQVSSKHQDLVVAGIDVKQKNSKKLLRNYRNSREILSAAFEVLYENLTDEIVDNKEFAILDPQQGFFNGPAPLILEAEDLAGELAATLSYLRNETDVSLTAKCCIALCGYSLQEIERFGKKLNLPVLDGNRDLSTGQIFLSDLENTKGFEFQFMCILNCSKDVIPYPGSPEVEQFRDLSRLYVAMTRARHQLIVSFNKELSPYLAKCQKFLEETWGNYLGCGIDKLQSHGVPERMESFRFHAENVLPAEMTGEQFLYSELAVGLDPLLIEKLRTLITGNRRFVSGKPVEWATLGEAAEDVRRYPASRNTFGARGHELFKALTEDLDS